MSRRIILVNTAFALLLSMVFAASVTHATPLNGPDMPLTVLQAATPTPTPDAGGLVPFPEGDTRVTTTLSGIVTTARLRVRDAGTLNGKHIFDLSQGQIVTILGIHRNRRWLEIQTGDGKVGWVSVFYIELVGGRLNMLPFVP